MKKSTLMNKSRLLFLLLLSAFAVQSLSAQWIVGFYTVGMGQPISEVPWDKITHLQLCCATAGPSGTFSENWLTPSSYAEIRSTAQAHGVKVIVSMIGLSADNWPAATAPGTVDTFVNNIKNYITNNGFDGVDLDWENGLNITQYISLITKLRAAMPNKLITVDTGNWGGLETVAGATHQSLDQVNVMCYDMAAGNGVSFHNDALLQAGNANMMTCDWRMRSLTNAGVPASKLGIGMPAYGYVWSGTTQPGTSSGTMDWTQWYYSQIVSNPTWWNGGLNKRWDNTYKADYLSVASTNQFVTYNDTQSVHETVAWGKAQGVGGYMLLFLYQEYMAGAGGDARYPLSSALYKEVRGGTSATPPSITSASPLANGTVGTAYTQTLTANGSTPLTWTVSGSLPAGLSLASGVISGTPTSAGTFNFTIQAANTAGNTSKQVSLTVVTAMAGPSITSSSLASGTVGTAYTQNLSATGGSINWTVTVGSLPAGLSLGSLTGVIAGTPTSAGTFTFTIQAANTAGNTSKQFSLTVTSTAPTPPPPPSPSAPSITSASLPNGTVGTAYSQTLTATGATPLTWSSNSGKLPKGLALSSTGVLSGTPSSAGAFTFTVKATNAVGSTSKQVTLTVNSIGSGNGSGGGGATTNYYVSDLNWVSATAGWGLMPQKDISFGGHVLTLNGATYTKGIGTHADSQITYNLGGVCSSFQADVGIDDEVGADGSVTFQVVADGVTLYQSSVMTGSSATQNVNVSLTGKTQLALIVNSGDNIYYDHSDWANARLTCSSQPQ